MLNFRKEFVCDCQKTHNALIDEYIVANGAVNGIGDYVHKYGGHKPFIIADTHTYAAAGERVCDVLSQNGIAFSKYIFSGESVKPDEHAVGAVVMHFDRTCDMVIGVGSGVINDISKIVANTANVPYIIVATAPSMDGYASATSSMDVDGLKVSLPSKCANVIIGDLDILKQAPERMLIAGLGDMLAKYISIAEWRIAHLITGEYYCETVAQLIRTALQRCTENAKGLLQREDEAVKAVFEGLVIGGVAMNYAGLSRPASGVEHYFSHVWDMRGLEFGTAVDFHGIQCAIGTLYAAKIYEQIKATIPDREKAIQYAASFDYAPYREQLRAFLGKGADAMIALEAKEQKYSPEKHSERIDVILEKWDEILRIIDEEIPSAKEVEAILDTIHCPKTVAEIGIDVSLVPTTFAATKDIRDKYVASRLCWDLGILDEVKLSLSNG